MDASPDQSPTWPTLLGHLVAGRGPIELTDLERRVLTYLAERPDALVTYDELLREVWGYAARVRSRAVAKLLYRLRVKLGDHAEHLETVYGQGVRLQADGPVSALPAARGRFHGRTAEITALARHEDEGTPRLALVGPAGVGKSRLVRAWVERCAPRWPGGVLWCSMEGASTREEAVQVAARVLGLAKTGAEPEGQIRSALAGRGRVLLVLDGWEELHGNADDVVQDWTDQLESLGVLLTSRMVPALEGVHVVPVAPLAHGDAVAMLEDRAQAAGAPVPEAPVTAELVAVLDHHPLAIELAAARLRVMDGPTLLTRLDEQLPLLSPPGAAAPLRAVLTGAWELLTAPEQAALASLAVFEGGFTPERFEAVAELPAGVFPADVLQGLVDKSLVTPLGAGRFGLLSAVRELAAERLANGGQQLQVEQRHGEAFASLGSPDMYDRLRGPDGERWFRTLVSELGNLILACRRALARADGSVATSAAVAIGQVVRFRGHPRALARSLLHATRALELSATQVARVHMALGWVELDVDPEAMRSHAQQAAEAFARAGDRRGQARSWVMLASGWSIGGRPDRAHGVLEDAHTLASQAQDAAVLPAIERLRGELALKEGRVPEAVGHLEQAAALAERHGNLLNGGIILGTLAWTLVVDGQLERAVEVHEAARAPLRAFDNLGAEMTLLNNLGRLYNHTGDLHAARDHFAQVHRRAARAGAVVVADMTLANRANADRRLGRLRAAEPDLRRALAGHRAGDRPARVSFVLSCLGELHLDQGDLERADATFAEAARVGRACGHPRHEAVGLAGRARAAGLTERWGEALDHATAAVALAPRISVHSECCALLARLGWVEAHARPVDETPQRLIDAEVGIRGPQSDQSLRLEVLMDCAEAWRWLGEPERAKPLVDEAWAWVQEVEPGAALRDRVLALRDD